MRQKWATLTRAEQIVIVVAVILFSPALFLVGIVLFVYIGWVYLLDTLEWLFDEDSRD